ncbi:MAG: glycosyltransferase family 4 protein [Anaerolineales bacterium]
MPKPGVYNVAHLYYPELNIGGVEQHIRSLVAGEPEKYRWFLIAPVSQVYREVLNGLGVAIPNWNPKSIWKPGSLLALIRLLRKHRIHLLHIHGPEAFISGKLAALACQIPVIITVHLRFADYFRGRSLLAWLKRSIYLFLDSILNLLVKPYTIYVSERDRERNQKRENPTRVYVVRNGVDIQEFSSAKNARYRIRRSIGISPSTLIVSFIGRLDHQKGVNTLLSAYKDFSEHRPNTTLWLIGDGPLRGECEEMVANNQNGKVVFWGFRDDVPELLSATDIFVLPSNYEGTSFALLEAMASRLPVIATEVGEANRIIKDGITGILIPPEDTERMAGALLDLATNSSLRRKLGGEARKTMREFSIGQMVDDVSRVYRQALKLDQ